jgi:hypothetical protein
VPAVIIASRFYLRTTDQDAQSAGLTLVAAVVPLPASRKAPADVTTFGKHGSLVT